MGLQMAVGTEMEITYLPDKAGAISFKTRFMVSGSQGLTPVEEVHTIELFERTKL